MQGIIFNSEQEANDMLAAIDANGGYPKLSTPIGGGVHADTEEAETSHATYIIKHPTLSKWAVAVVNGTALLVPQGTDVVTLSSDWFPTYNP